ncbi:MAG: hypothetical protein HKP30_17300 [Myxococcales bacterium]|nr:hypothetical protein [Myxococcales bacterium]
MRFVFACLMLGVGLAVFAIRLQHAGPYDPPEGGNLLGAVLALLIGGLLLAPSLPKALRWIALAASPVALFLALYATLAELEEVVVLTAPDRSGAPVDLRLWITDRDDGEWVTMPESKARAHGLDDARVELLRKGERRCVLAMRHDDRAIVNAVHREQASKYAVQRLAARIGLFGEEAAPEVVAIQLTPCPAG